VQLGRALVDRIGPKGKLIRAVAGFDCTFSAPKSVSILWALTGDAGVVEAHDVAVRATLDYLERNGATTRVRVHDRRQFTDANGLTMAVFQQGTSREDDPQLHTHVVVSGKVTAPDGRWLALDPQEAPARPRRLLPVGAALGAGPPLPGGMGADRQRAGRDRRHAARAAGGVLEADRPGRGAGRPAGRGIP
jgi:hypothetical protein